MHSGEKQPPAPFVTTTHPHLHLACYTSSHISSLPLWTANQKCETFLLWVQSAEGTS